ncbi:hypothetical protein [Picosynechococcus sp. PCC 8807]|uniref:hypothetical protein n=1 Tax=Picosynechococcus sp. PCC 8807 TaxID=195248 RepID=UPI000810C7F0|nr:hypothetical protein [Picosynechococcus sp. PCC 8807]ANV90674.1 hypothetical protein AWQ24_08555 [Picosynechococcus sp. PCC 8807]
MSCENLVTTAAFQSEIKKLKAEIASLKKGPTIDPAILTVAIGSYFAGGGEIPSLGKLINSEVTKQTKPIVKNFSYEIGRWGEQIYDTQSDVRKIKVTTQQNSKAIRAAQNQIKRTNGLLGKLQGNIRRFGDNLLRRSKLLNSLKGRIDDLLRKLAPFLRHIAPFLRILDFFLTGYSIYQLVQLTRRMSNAERAILAAQAGLSYATGRALFALTRINQVEAMNNRNAASIKALIRSEHRQTRGSINGNVNSQHAVTRAAIGNNSGVTALNGQVRSLNSQLGQFRAEFRTFNNGLNSRLQTYVTGPLSRQIGRLQSLIGSVNTRVVTDIRRYVTDPVIDWNNRNLLPKLNGIQSRLDQTYNKLVDRFNKLWDYMKMDRILRVITTAATIHNAAMLSRNLAASLLDTIGETLGIIGLKDPDGQPYNLNAILGRSAQDLIVGMIGQQAFNNLSEDWRNWNRIISAGAGVVMSLRNIQWAIAEGVENLNTWVARIGNGLEDDGVVTDRKWPWMRENVGITRITGLDKLTNTLESAEEITENIYATVASGQEIAESVTQLRQAKASFDQTLQTDETTQTTEQQTKETESESPTPSVDDLAEFEPEPEE